MQPFPSLTSKSQVQALLVRHGVAPHKQLGQNFLFDGNVLRAIAEAAQPDGKAVLEIGPGMGALTQQLASRAGRVLAVEIDHGFLPILQETLSPWGAQQAQGRLLPVWEADTAPPAGLWSAGNRAAVVHGDILKTSLAQLAAWLGGGAFTVCANLPYYITTPILMALLVSGLPIERVVVLVQKEMAERLAASPGSKQYGSLSLAAQYYAHSRTLFDVSASCFLPAPKVDSTVLELLPHPTALCGQAETQLFSLIRAGFAMRRKTLANNLRAAFPEAGGARIQEALGRCGLPLDIRAERLGMQDFMQLSAAFFGDEDA